MAGGGGACDASGGGIFVRKIIFFENFLNLYHVLGQRAYNFALET